MMFGYESWGMKEDMLLVVYQVEIEYDELSTQFVVRCIIYR